MKGYENHDLAKRVEHVLEPWVFEEVRNAKGSVSAEHGVGLHKKDYLSYSKSAEMIKYMK